MFLSHFSKRKEFAKKLNVLKAFKFVIPKKKNK